MARLPLRRRLAYATGTTILFFGGLTSALGLLDRAGWIDTFRQDDSVLYIHGAYLRPDPSGNEYTIHDAQADAVVQARFPVHKRAGTVRIFVTGESFVRGGHQLDAGSPPAGHGTLSDWMQEVLEARYPSRRFEVINAGANGQTSTRIARVVEELVHAAPDLVVVAMGNNEGVDPGNAASSALQGWILYRFLKREVLPEPGAAERPAFTLQGLAPERARAVFNQNLAAIVTATRDAGVPLLLATLPINLTEEARTLGRAPPDPSCDPVDRAASARSCDAALEAGSACGDRVYAVVRAGDCLAAVGRTDEARQLYEVAVELDPRGRTRPSFNEMVRQTAAASGALLTDLEKTMQARSGGIPGDRYFIDHVHLTCMGYLPVAEDLVDTIVASGLVHGLPWEPRATPTAAELLAAHPWPAEPARLRPSLVPPHALVPLCAADPAGG